MVISRRQTIPSRVTVIAVLAVLLFAHLSVALHDGLHGVLQDEAQETDACAICAIGDRFSDAPDDGPLVVERSSLVADVGCPRSIVVVVTPANRLPEARAPPVFQHA